MPRERTTITARSGRCRRPGNQGGTATIGTISVAGREILHLEVVDDRLRVALTMPVIARHIDITASPGTALHALRDAALRADVPFSQVEADARRTVRSVMSELETRRWHERDADLIDLFGGASFPLLDAAYDAGAAPIANVPGWAVEVLGAPTASMGARMAFADRTTRPVVAALAHSLVRLGDAPVDLSRLALARIGASVLEPDHLVDVLRAPGDPWPDVALVSSAQVEAGAQASRWWGATRTRGFLLEAAADASGHRLLDECITLAVDLRAHGPVRLPYRLDALLDAYRLGVRSAVRPADGSTGTRRRRRTVNGRHDDWDAEMAELVADVDAHRDDPDRHETPLQDHGQYLPPRVHPPVRVDAHTPIHHPGWLLTIDGTSSMGMTYRLPNACGDLTRWAHALGNCLDSYGQAAVTGSSHLIGVTRDGALVYVVEVTPRRVIRQFSGRANLAPCRDDHTSIVNHLRSHHVIGRGAAQPRQYR